MKIYVLWNENSYFNRTIERKETVGDYTSSCDFFAQDRNVAFNIADGVMTTWVMNATLEYQQKLMDAKDPSYLLLVDNSTNEEAIISRWFVTECVYNRAGQWTLQLRRDVVADFLAQTLAAKCILERGPLSAENPLIHNEEDGTVNRIKRNETLLKDESGKAWIVGYLSKDTSALSITSSTETMADYPELSDLNLTLINPADPTEGATFEAFPDNPRFYVPTLFSKSGSSVNLIADGEVFGYVEDFFLSSYVLTDSGDYGGSWQQQAMEDARAITSSVYASQFGINEDFKDRTGLHDQEELRAVISADGKIFHDSDSGKYYQLSVAATVTTQEPDLSLSPTDEKPALYFRVRQICVDFAESDPNVSANSNFVLIGAKYKRTRISVSISEISPQGLLKMTIPSSRRNLTDAPYDMFCMPFSSDNLALAQALISQPLNEGEKKKVYDLQILPFCPRRDSFDPAASALFVEDEDYTKILESDGNGGWTDTGGRVLFCLKSSDTFFIDKTVYFYSEADLPQKNIKISEKCELFRLTSPNYASSFEFSVARNGGVSSFRVDFTYRPISPYIHVAPFFSGLYGDVNDDARGLICGGDFSVDVISDAWTEYQTQNKNYQNIFNTRIKALDESHVFDRAKSIIGSVASTAASAAAGAHVGGPAGAGASGAVAAATGLFNIAASESKYEIERSAQVETFRLQLGNVVAVPDTLAKVSAYNVNNKYFPIIEYYVCTNEEIAAFSEYIDEFNYRIDKLGTIGSCLESRAKSLEYVRGRIVRFMEAVDPHIANEIYAEISKGVYFK